jgi:hypothetical protein
MGKGSEDRDRKGGGMRDGSEPSLRSLAIPLS